MKTIGVVAGIRSQYIKMASLQRAVAGLKVREKFVYIDAAQHYSKSLSSQYFDEYKLEFDYSLRKFRLPLDPEARLGAMEYRLYDFFKDFKLNHVVVFGDANTTLAAALAAKRTHSFLTHIEAGVRTGDSSKEEINRKVTDYIADFHIASCRLDYENLCKEGYAKSSELIGDIVRDLCITPIRNNEIQDDGAIVVTLHHTADWDDSFLGPVFELLGSIKSEVLFFSHPRVLRAAKKYSKIYRNINVNQSIPHAKLLAFIKNAKYVITDSGALQRESFYLGKRVLVVQKAPFWKSLIDCGFNLACAPKISEIREGIQKMEKLRKKSPPIINDFGVPPVGEKIIKKLLML